MKNQSVLIGSLTLTAIVLGVILLALPGRESQGVMSETHGDFTMLTSGATIGDEPLTIIDNRNEKLLVYRLINNNLEVIARMTPADFAKAFGRNAPASK